MSAYRTLAELLLEEAEAEPIISRIPTASRHEHHCRVILNQILIEDPGSCPLIISLCAYPVQSWADHMRNSLDLDLFSLQKFLEENGCEVMIPNVMNFFYYGFDNARLDRKY